MADNRVAYGLAKKHGIDTTGMSPQQVWDALKEKGISLGSDREADKEQLARKYSDNEISTHQPPVAKGFNRSKTKSHLSHAQEMGLNEKQYVKAAEKFFNSDRGKLYRSSNGKYYRYEEENNLVCICSQDGTIHSYYKYKTKNAFGRAMRQEKLEEIK